MISFAKETDMPEVYRNWEESFGDTKEEIESFFKAFAGKVQVCIVKREGDVAGQLCLLPVQLFYCNGGSLQAVKAAYIYGVATGKKYRRKGICTELLEDVKALLLKRGLCGVLVPAGKELEAFYEKRGFRRLFQEESIILQSDEAADKGIQDTATGEAEDTTDEESAVSSVTGIKESTVSAYIEYRNKAFAQSCRIQEPEGMIRYALETFLKEGGQCCEFIYKAGRYGILYRKTGEIREITAGDTKEAVAVAKAFLKTLGKTEGVLRRSFPVYGIHLPKEKEERGYFNLVLE
ncbi:MAG: GNAT family N-acetyltransferase [Lachnospiraceae bacterium]